MDAQNATMNDTLAMRSNKVQQEGISGRSFQAVLWASAAIAILLTGCGGTKEASEEAPTVTVQVGAAEKEAIKQEIRAEAILYPRDQAALIPKVAAPVSKFFVDRGSIVHAGQVLAELENRDLVSASADTAATQQQAEVALQSANQKAEQDLKVAKEQLDAAQKVF